MCGIAGSFLIDPSASPAGDRIHAALAALAHRGPDDAGVYRQGRAVLGHRRLSIIDTSAAGHQHGYYDYWDENAREISLPDGARIEVELTRPIVPPGTEIC